MCGLGVRRRDALTNALLQIELINTNFKLIQDIHHEFLFNRLNFLYEKVCAFRRASTAEEIMERAPFVFSQPELNDRYKWVPLGGNSVAVAFH